MAATEVSLVNCSDYCQVHDFFHDFTNLQMTRVLIENSLYLLLLLLLLEKLILMG